MIKNDNSIRTRRWTRSPRGEILGVATGLAEWRGFPAGTTRLIIFLIVLFSGIFPGAIVYLIAAIILPEQKEEDIACGSSDSSFFKRKKKGYEDAEYSEAGKSKEDLKREYDDLKKKVEEMETSFDDKEKNWDSRFNGDRK